jgi:DinB family protein
VTIKEDVLSSEEEGWHELQARFAKFSGDDWTRPGPAGEWSAKDVLAHIACWHAEITHHLEHIRTTGNDLPWPELEEFNQRAYAQCAEMTLHEVQAMSGAARHRYREEVATLAPVAMGPRLLHEIRWAGDLHYRGDASERGHVQDLDDLLGAQ